ncbi:MAG: LysM peptidoglycan-binding domain-containing protein [Candidatus Sericytochromatia bacterium]
MADGLSFGGINFSSFIFSQNVTAKKEVQVPLRLDAETINDMKATSKDNVSINKMPEASVPSLSFSEENPVIEHKIKRGESLSDISKKYFGKPDHYMDIFKANKDKLLNPNELVIGMTIKIPVSADDFKRITQDNKQDNKIEPPNNTPNKTDISATPKTTEFKEVTVKRGESLSILALEHLGNAERYMEIFNANRDQLKTTDSLKIGMKLKIPVVENPHKPSEPVVEPVSNNVIDNSEFTAGAKNIYDALKRYQSHYTNLGNVARTRTTDSQMKQISVELDKASKAFGVDPKIMLAVFAHESNGFNPNATSHTGAGGLGQLTSIAIRQVHYMAGMVKGQEGRLPYTDYKENFIKSQTKLSQRHDISKNIWTSTAYMSYEIKDRNNGNIKRSLERYGDPNVSTYENKVNQEYKVLFGKSLF